MASMNCNKLRLLYIADSTSVHTRRWLKYFADVGHDIYIITIGKKRKVLPYATHLINLEQFYYDSPRFLLDLVRVRRIIRHVRPHILHAHFVHQYGWLGALVGYHPFVLTAWGTDILKLPDASRGKIGKWLTQYALKKADTITVTSHHAKAMSISLGAAKKQVHVIFWGIDVDRFRPDIDSGPLRRRLGIPDDAPVILSNRNLSPLYNNDIVIKAMKQVIVHFPDAVLILQNAGGSPGAESEYKALTRSEGVDHAVRFLPQVDYDDMPIIYALADVYVTVPSWDAGPVSLKEAMASGCAPVISELPAPREWIEHEKNGLVVPVRDSEKLSAAVCELLANSAKRVRFGSLNRELIIERAQAQPQMRLVETIYASYRNIH